MKKIRWILALTTVLLIILDQIVKQWARIYLMPVGRIPIIDGLIGFRYATNTGAAFGIFQGGRWFFVILTIIVLAVIIIYEFKLPHTKQNLWIRIPMTLMLAGAVGNFIDRLLFGYVVDMFEFLFFNFPIFNVADMLLVIGTFGYAFAALFILKEESKEEPESNG